MTNINQREYYKIFTGTNQSGGYDKVHLGYQAQTNEIILKKDQETFFHVPYFASAQIIQNSTLVGDGAIAGPIPALADRIYKKLGGYGNTTPWGDASDRTDGTWLCTWLFAVSSEPPRWLDRYYNPGRLAYKEALEGEANFNDYLRTDISQEVYFDEPSTMVLEPGVLYKYFHQGEQTATNSVITFAGNNKTRLRLDIERWSGDTLNVDDSIYKNRVEIKEFKDNWIVNYAAPGYIDRSILSFENSDFIDCKVIYNSALNLENEFTLSFWVYNNDWNNATNTQLVGNLKDSGFSVGYNNLNYNPFFIVPENYYGHIFYFNEDGNSYTERNIQVVLGENSNPVNVNINTDNDVICTEKNNKRVIKYNYLGDVLTRSKEFDGSEFQLEGEPKLSILDIEDNLTVITTLSTYTFDRDLLLLSAVNTPYGFYEQVAYELGGTLRRELSCTDLKFDSYNQKWTINHKGNLYCNNLELTGIPTNNYTELGTNTNIAIDPENNLWVLAGSNTVYKINTRNKSVIDTFNVGIRSTRISDKNISFIKTYNRRDNNFTWYAVIYHNLEKYLYLVTLDGKIYKSLYIPQRLNTLDPITEAQNRENLQFTGKGDFTGYEWRRVFNNLKFNNKPQIQFKVGLKSNNPFLPNSIKTISVPVSYFVNSAWHLVTVTLKSSELKIYLDNLLRLSAPLPFNTNFNNEFKTDLYIGTPVGRAENYNYELQTDTIIWNGFIDSIRLYDYAIEPKFIQYFVREKTPIYDIEWNIPTTALQYVEVVERFFKHRLPGAKSNFFNIKISGSQITDTTIRQRIESDIRYAVDKIKPAYTELLHIEWID